MKRPAPRLALLLLLLLPTPLAATAATQASTAAVPHVLRAVGRLDIPGSRVEDGLRRHYREHCSGTLLAAPDAVAAALVLTAWHCLDYYTDLSRTIRFGLQAADGALHWLPARVIADGGSMAADWALLRLQRPLPLERFVAARVSARAPRAGDAFTMAGFPAATRTPGSRRRLRYHAGCRSTGHAGADLLTNCLARKGASGGAVFSGDRLVGVVSRGDGAGRSIFVPTARFRGRLRSLLD